MIQGELFDTGLARGSDPDTSKAAAETINTTKLEAEVLSVIRSFGDKGCIADQVEAKMPHLQWCTITPRFQPLLRKGLIEDTGERRKGVSRRQQRVVRAVDPARVEQAKVNYLQGKFEVKLNRIVTQVRQLGPTASRIVVSRLSMMGL